VNADHPARLSRAAAAARERGLDALLVPPGPDLVYLLGYGPMPLERLTMLVLRPGAEPVLIVPELERPLAAATPAGELVVLIGWRDTDDPYAEVGRILPAAARLAVGDHLWASHLLKLQAVLPAASFEPASSTTGSIRAVKDADELDALARAGRAADDVFRDICSLPFAGRREDEVASDLARLLVEHGHHRADFTIVGSGPNSASPHHEAGTREIRTGDAVVLDFGGEVDGYFSDTTRTVVVGDGPDGFKAVYDAVRDAQQAAFEAVGPGVPAEHVDRAARSVIEAAGYGERFVHRTGHGIGLEVHEAPDIVEGNDTLLAPGMTFSLEPGIYLEGRFGVRIEDIVAVTAEGAERLNDSPRDLQVVT